MILPAALALALYAAGAARLWRRGDAWPWWRVCCFAVGCLSLTAVGLVAPPGGEFTAHMVTHLVVGMYAPLLLVLGRPVTLLLRALPPGAVRRTVVAVARSRPVAVLVFPPVAAALDVGGLWALYRTPLFAAAQAHPWLHALVHAHVFAAGVLFAAAVCQLEPLRHRSPVSVRGASLVVAGALHSILAKSLWISPPPGTAFAPADLRTAAEVMYYGGDLAEIALAVVLATGWYAAHGRTLRHRLREVA